MKGKYKVYWILSLILTNSLWMGNFINDDWYIISGISTAIIVILNIVDANNNWDYTGE